MYHRGINMEEPREGGMKGEGPRVIRQSGLFIIPRSILVDFRRIDFERASALSKISNVNRFRVRNWSGRCLSAHVFVNETIPSRNPILLRSYV